MMNLKHVSNIHSIVFFFLNLFILELMNLPCDAVNEIIQRHFSKIYDQIDRYILHNKIT
jgi:hypothetical protein